MSRQRNTVLRVLIGATLFGSQLCTAQVCKPFDSASAEDAIRSLDHGEIKLPFWSVVAAAERGARDSKVLAYFRIPLSPPASLNCREIPPSFPPKYANYAHLLRLFLSKPDRRERTAQLSTGPLSGLFSAGHMRSPVSSRDKANANAIRSRGFGHSELTLISPQPVSGLFLNCRPSARRA
jgi:hypothetical protein